MGGFQDETPPLSFDGADERPGRVADRVRALETTVARQRHRPVTLGRVTGSSALPMFLQGTRERCVRHGRKPAPRDMVERSRNGAYVPTGMMTRRQVEATSPWATANTSKQVKGSDVCPDCAAELSMWRREAMQTVMRPIDGSQGYFSDRSDLAPPPQSPLLAPMAMRPAVSPGATLSSWLPCRRDASGHAMPSSQQPTPLGRLPETNLRSLDRLGDISNSSCEDTGDLVVSQNLGHRLDAAIFAQHGELERVIVNSRLGRPTVDLLQQLSRELSSVAHELSFAGSDSKVVLAPTTHHRAAVFTTSPSPARQQHSVADLMSLIDNAIETLRPCHQSPPGVAVVPFPVKYNRAPQAPRNLENAHWQIVPAVQYPDDDDFRAFAAKPMVSTVSAIAEAVRQTQPAVAKAAAPYTHAADMRTGMEFRIQLPPSLYSRAPPAPRNLQHVEWISVPAVQHPDDDEYQAFAANPLVSTIDSIAEAVEKIKPAIAATATPYTHTANRRTGLAATVSNLATNIAAIVPPSAYARAPEAPRNLSQAQWPSVPLLQFPDDESFRNFAANPEVSTLDSLDQAAKLLEPALAALASPYRHAADRRTDMQDVVGKALQSVADLGTALTDTAGVTTWPDTRLRESTQLLRSGMRLGKEEALEKAHRKMSL